MTTRVPAVAGSFYPNDAQRLIEEVDGLLASAPRPALERSPRAIIAPHAGYAYSGRVAATAYVTARPEAIKRVVVIGPAHFVPLHGIAAPRCDKFATPLGDVAVDRDLRARTAAMVRDDDVPHAPEHSVEVHLPFVLRRIPHARLLPLVCGDATADEVADVLQAMWDDATLVVCSTDLSHYLPDHVARDRDLRTADAICQLAPERIGATDACGAYALRGVLEAARRAGLSAVQLDLRTSADAGGDPDRVVGYGAFAIA